MNESRRDERKMPPDDVIRRLLAEGWSARRFHEVYGCSTNTAYQHINRLKKEDEAAAGATLIPSPQHRNQYLVRLARGADPKTADKLKAALDALNLELAYDPRAGFDVVPKPAGLL